MVDRAPTIRLTHQPALDGLRGLAVLGVVAYHARADWARGGFLGVDTFFVLSGFLITSLLLEEHRAAGAVNWARFAARRAQRLLPALAILLVVLYLCLHTLEPPSRYAQLRTDGLASAFYVANWRLIASGQSYFDLAAPSPLRHLWSLAIEEQFYLVWPAVVLVTMRVARGRRQALAVVAATGAIASAIAMSVLYHPGSLSRAYYGTDTRVHALLVGALLAAISAPGRTVMRRRIAHPAGVVAFVAMVVCWARVGDQWSGYYRGGSLAYAVVVAVLISATTSVTSGPARRLLSWRPLTAVGRISYGVYLWHWPIDVYATSSRVHQHGAVLQSLRLAGTFGAAIVSYVLVERPILHRRSTPPRTLLAATSGAVAVSVLLVTTTAGAAPPPRYAGVATTGDPRPSLCPAASPAERRTGDELATRFGVRRVEARPLVIAVVGDSWACSLLTGLEPVGARSNVTFRNGSVLGCGVVADAVVPVGGLPPIGWRQSCRGEARRREASTLTGRAPDLVVWYSSWEKSDQYVRGVPTRFGDPAVDRLLRSRMAAAVHRLTARGSRLVILTDAPRPPSQQLPSTDPADDAKTLHLDELYRQVARSFPGRVRVIDLVPKLCPTGTPCVRTVAGVTPRPLDGSHFDPEGATWMAAWLVPQLRQIAR